MTQRFTGWHMAAIMTAFFGVVIAVNFTMARLAVGSFGGSVVDNSYVASQRYNDWLAQARLQAALHWTSTVSTDADHHVRVAVTTPLGLLEGARVTATATHPLGALPSVDLIFTRDGGAARSTAPLPAGRWLVHIDVAHGRNRAAFDDDIRA